MRCITLLSDFGLVDAKVASTKAMLMQYVPSATIIDLSHSVEPFYVQQAAYILASAYNSFPAGSVHVSLFDIFSERHPRLLLCRKDGHYFLAPDNGILSLATATGYDYVWQCLELQPEQTFKDWLVRVCEVIGMLSNHQADNLPLPKGLMRNMPTQLQPRIDGNMVECHVIHIDRFENVVVNITRQQFEEFSQGRTFRIQYIRNEAITTVSRRYTDVREGEKLCRFNSADYLEIAINKGKAASLLGLRLYQPQHVMYNTVKIIFG